MFAKMASGVRPSDDAPARVPTGVPGLDDLLGGGFLPRSANLVEGAPGTGKSTLGLQFIYNGAVLHQDPGLILTFEQFPQQYYESALSFGWDLSALEKRGMLRVLMTSPEVGRSDLEAVNGRMETLVREMGAKRVLVDSISRFSDLGLSENELRGAQHAFINGLKREGLTALLTSESLSLLGLSDRLADRIAYVVDSYLLLRYVEVDSSLRRALLVLKMRGSQHDRDIRQYDITTEGFTLRARFEGREGILSGNSRRMTDNFDRAFPRH
ncbi:MAG: RAD55 family ATPase [Anaerolineae bacterium]